MAQYKTPGVYVEEKSAFPNSVVEVPTAVPAFLGYTEKAKRGSEDLKGIPTRITSLSDYANLFGGPPSWQFTWQRDENGKDIIASIGQEFLLFLSIQIFFNNGGGTCWIVSVGGYGADTYEAKDFDGALAALAKEPEPTIYLIPDAVKLSKVDHAKLNNKMLMQCAKLQSRVAILDLYEGAGVNDPSEFPLARPISEFRNSLIEADDLSYGMAYAPWLNTNLVEPSGVDFTNFDIDSRKALAALLLTELDARSGSTKEQTDIINRLSNAKVTPETAERTDAALLELSGTYKQVMQTVLARINLLPPSGAMAGVWTRTDNEVGVFKAPANTGIISVTSPAVSISDVQQEDMNVPLAGRAVNAIRTFMGRGTLVWGARTLEGNSQDWRYINVRRTIIMLEQSIEAAAKAYVFAPNDAGTWAEVKTMIENFLNNQWKAGALAGATPAEAYDVSVGLGSTMTGNDILDGYMRVTVRLAVTSPAEFIVVTFQQKMQTS